MSADAGASPAAAAATATSVAPMSGARRMRRETKDMSFPLIDMTTPAPRLKWTVTTYIGVEAAGGKTPARKTVENGTDR